MIEIVNALNMRKMAYVS